MSIAPLSKLVVALLPAIAIAGFAMAWPIAGSRENDSGELAQRRTPFTISDRIAFNVKSGESVSAVIAPGKKVQCPKGRLFIADDSGVASSLEFVHYVGLDALASTPQKSVFQALPSLVTVAGNDHELLSLANGDLVYIRVAWIRTPLKAKPSWFDVSYDFDKKLAKDGLPDSSVLGPGTRKGLAVWRSEDGGANFSYVSTFDLAHAEDGSGALPMNIPRTAAPGTPSDPVYRNGGTDGPLAKVDRTNNKIYATLWCIGNEQDKSKRKYTPDPNKRLSKSIILSSSTFGSSWKSLGFFDVALWRGHVVPLENGMLCFGNDNDKTLYFAKPMASGKYSFDANGTAPNGPDYGAIGLKGESSFGAQTGIQSYMKANVTQRTIAFRTGSKRNVAIAYPTNLGSAGHGYSLYYHDRATKYFGASDPIKPQAAGKDNFIMHLSAVDLGSGPILLYWYDVNVSTFLITIRGRMILGDGSHSSDFTISRASGKPEAFDMRLGTTPYWYGDFHQAEGYVDEVKPPKGTIASGILSKFRYHYYPIWVQPDGTTRIAHLSYGPEDRRPEPVDVPILVSDIPSHLWKRGQAVPKTRLKSKEYEID